MGLSCTPDNVTAGCLCVGKTETGTPVRLDLSGAFSYPITVADKDPASGRSYSISLCKSIICGPTVLYTSVCLNNGGAYSGCGKPGLATWTVTSFSPMSYSIFYPKGNDGKGQSLVTVTEDSKATSNSIVMTGITNNLQYEFSIVLGTGSEVAPGIVGLTLISVSLVGFCCYIAIGMAIGYRVKGARGIEMVPQLAFWKDLPFLIKDGILFSFSPCCKRDRQYTKL
ncbi:hypothetical protein EMCRGX_G008374 [Ephydatia muelleri]